MLSGTKTEAGVNIPTIFSDSQSGCRVEVLGVLPNINFTVFYSSFTAMGVSDCPF